MSHSQFSFPSWPGRFNEITYRPLSLQKDLAKNYFNVLRVVPLLLSLSGEKSAR